MKINLQSHLKINSIRRIVHLKWNNPSQLQFRVLMAQSKSLPLFQVGETKADHFEVPVDYFFSRIYRFAIIPVNRTGSPLEVVELKVPTVDLPKARITCVRIINEEATVSWMFPFDIPDLEGFSLSINNKLLPRKINRSIRSVTLPKSTIENGHLRVHAFTENKACESRSNPSRIHKSNSVTPNPLSEPHQF